jgi:twinkle protein
MMQFEDLGIKTKPGKQRYYTQCPQCNETRQKNKNALCLTVNDEVGNRWYKCHHCDWSGNLDVQDKYDKVREKSAIPSKERMYTMGIRDYLKKRGISQTTAKQAKVYETTFRKQSTLAFPYFMNLTLVNVKFLNPDWKKGDKGPKWWQLPKDLGTRIIPFGMQGLQTHNDAGERFNNNILIITEGEWDMLTWKECGYKNVVSVPQGAPSVNSKNFDKEFQYLQDKYVQSVLKDIDLFYLSVDNDEAGKKLRGHLAMILGKDKCRIIRYPVGYKDINEVLVGNEEKGLAALGKKGVDECFENSSSVPIRGVIKASMVHEELKILREGGFEPGLGCGISEVDYLFTVKPKHIMFVTGVPGSGKSVWIRWWLVEMIKHNVDLNLKWAMFTPENRPVSREYAKIAEALTGLSLHKGQKNSMSDEQYRQAMRFVEKHFFIISPDKYNYETFGNSEIGPDKVNTLESIERYLIYLKKTENIFGYVIDAWNKIEHEQPRWQSETTFISEQLDKLIDFNAFWDVHGIVIVHPRKIETASDGNYKAPTLYDVKGSSAWKEKADIGVIIHRYKLRKLTQERAAERGLSWGDLDEDEKYEVMERAPTIIRTEKIRFEEIGHENRVKMEMSTWGRFSVVKPKAVQKDPNIPDPDDRIESGKLFADDDDDDLPF